MAKARILGIIAIMLAFLALAPSITSAAGPTLPSGIQSYVSINLTNSQSTATPSPFQQMINLTESNAIYGSYIAYSGSLANFEYFYSNGTIIPACQSARQRRPSKVPVVVEHARSVVVFGVG